MGDLALFGGMEGAVTEAWRYFSSSALERASFVGESRKQMSLSADNRRESPLFLRRHSSSWDRCFRGPAVNVKSLVLSDSRATKKARMRSITSDSEATLILVSRRTTRSKSSEVSLNPDVCTILFCPNGIASLLLRINCHGALHHVVPVDALHKLAAGFARASQHRAWVCLDERLAKLCVVLAWYSWTDPPPSSLVKQLHALAKSWPP